MGLCCSSKARTLPLATVAPRLMQNECLWCHASWQAGSSQAHILSDVPRRLALEACGDPAGVISIVLPRQLAPELKSAATRPMVQGFTTQNLTAVVR
ncbi:hypothetical protein AVEN_5235-1 [Araneus ventricosus]|uniref:Uncharacterized protein n=1 Tax=Araneus ventricosus TaxID=182803 RepID=A0A4Y2T745_ARAVE|nr:hypothetical protein AVEN_5235-1 [Araneus ventricosus]